MFEWVVLGMDPGLAATGLAAVGVGGERAQVLWSTTLRTPAGLDEGARLRMLFEAADAALSEYRPEAVAMERLMWGRNVGSAMAVARASGVLLLSAAARGIPLSEYAPLEVKMAVAGSGNATKEQVRRALSRLHRVDGVPDEPDAADAVAVAICHAQQAPLRRAVSRA